MGIDRGRGSDRAGAPPSVCAPYRGFGGLTQQRLITHDDLGLMPDHRVHYSQSMR
jgi:hypothetical protein